MSKADLPQEQDLSAEDWDHEAAHAILGKFLSRDTEAVLDMMDQLEDPVVAGAVVIRICTELDPSQIAEFLALLEDESGEEDEDDGEPVGEDPDEPDPEKDQG